MCEATGSCRPGTDGVRRQLALAASLFCLLFGWLSPQYAAKLWGPALGTFLAEQPLAAALFSQAFWAGLLVVPAGGRRRSGGGGGGEEGGLPGPGASTSSGRGCHRLPESLQWAALAVALPFSILVFIVHVAWYASYDKTNVATNTLLWNTDTVTTPLVAVVVAREHPAFATMIGGLVGLVGAGLAVGANEAGNTLLGCGLVFVASVGFAVNAVLVEKVRDPQLLSVPRLLALEGIFAILALALGAVGAAAFAPGALAEWLSLLPSFEWLVFLGINSLLLNVGWLSCTEMAGSFWTAMVACLTIPLTMGLDLLLVGKMPTLFAAMGASLVVVGFLMVTIDRKSVV